MEVLIILLSIFLATSVFGGENPVISLLCLVSLYSISSLLLTLFSSKFLALLILLLYIGAIATLILFSIILLNLRVWEIAGDWVSNGWLGLSLGLIFFWPLEKTFSIDKISFEKFYFQLNLLESNELINLANILFFECWLIFLSLAISLLISLLAALSLNIKS